MDEATLFAFLLVFVRASAMMLATSVFGGNIPVILRVFAAGAISAAVTPVVMGGFGPPPEHLAALWAAVGREAAAGLLIGMMLQLVVLTFQQAGSILDLQIGFSTSQVLNPATGIMTTILAHFKSMLAVVLILLLNGHHVALRAFADSYAMSPSFGFDNLGAWVGGLVELIGRFAWLAIQIAAPAAGVAVIIDAAAGLANKAVPQMQVVLVSLPAKVLTGVVVMGIALPLTVAAVEQGVSTAFSMMETVLRTAGK